MRLRIYKVLTDIREQAEQMALRVVRLYGGAPCLSAFDFDETSLSAGCVHALVFSKPNKDWALFVLNNRNRKFNDLSDLLCNQDNKYDIVTGPVANDDIAYLFRTFSNGLIDIDALVRGLEYKSLSKQYSLHTPKSLRYLRATEG